MSTWFAAHIILYVQYKDSEQKSYPLWENVILIQADSEDEAFAKAECHGQKHEKADRGDFTWDGQAARWVFAGVRKLTLCEDADERPGDGTEVTYTQMRVRSREAIQKLVKGQRVGIELIEEFADRDKPREPAD